MVKFIVDSTFGVTREYALSNDISIVSLKTILDGVVADEGFEEEWAEFYTRLALSDSFPSTSQPNAEAYSDAIDAIYAKNADAEIIILTISNGLSGTINSARIAAERYKDKSIAVIDSQNACVASFIVLDELVALASNGAAFSDVVAAADGIIERTSVKFVPSTMKYLKKGGRIGTLGALVASIISVKPIFEFKRGVVAIPSKVLGFSKAIGEMVKMLPDRIKKMYVCYIGENEHIPLILQKVEALLGMHDVEIKAVSPVFGIHVGIGGVGIACIAEA